MKVLPNFFIVGAARAGTTSLHGYLSQHPDIFMTERKDSHFFTANHFPGTGPGDETVNRRVIHDEEQYTQLFASARGKKAIGEASPFYLCLPEAAERIGRAVPQAKILMILREPVARTYSAYTLLARDGRETLEFTEGLSREQERKQQGWEPMWWYKELSLYSSQVKRYLEVFGREQVKVLLHEDLFANPAQALREVFTFLGVGEDVAINTSVRYNLSGTPKSRWLYTLLSHLADKSGPLAKRVKPALAWKAMGIFLRPVPMLDPQIQAELKAYFAEDVGRLEDLLQRDLLCWHARKPSMVQKS